MRFLTLILALVLAGGIAAPAQAREVQAEDTVKLTFTKWFNPQFPFMHAVIGADIHGQFGQHSQVLSAVVSTDHRFLLLEARYEIKADDAEQSFTLVIKGKQNIDATDPQFNTAVLDGIVTEGRLTGQPVHVEFTQIDCNSQPPNHFCALADNHPAVVFHGTIRVRGDAEHEGSGRGEHHPGQRVAAWTGQ